MRTLVALASCLGALTAVGVSDPARAEDDDLPAYQWMLQGDAKEAVLMFARPESGDIPLEFACKPGSGRVQISSLAYDDAQDPKRLRLYLRSEGATASFAAPIPKAEFEDAETYPYASARFSIREPVLNAFAASGRLSEGEDGSMLRDATTKAEREAIETFFRFCERT